MVNTKVVKKYGNKMKFSKIVKTVYLYLEPSENNILDRCYQAALEHGANYVCRLPADNPVPEAEEMDRLVTAHIDSGFEFSSNLMHLMPN